VQRNGTILIPAFAIGRAQTILYLIYKLKHSQRIQDIPIFLDSPMAVDATEIFLRYSNEHKLSARETNQVYKITKYINTIEESKKIDAIKSPKIIISASGMAAGGRILHHIKAFASDSRNIILFTGYQAEGTRGNTMVRARQKKIKLLGKVITVNAEILELENVSAHADAKEIILWLKNFTVPPKTIFITHGEIKAIKSLQSIITQKLNWHCIIPNYMQEDILK